MRSTIYGCGTIAVCVVAFFALAFWILGDSPEPARRSQCVSNAREVGLAMLAYDKKEGHLPPAYVTDAAGRPVNSWRVLILPYLDQSELFKRYDLSKPWNNQKNTNLTRFFCIPTYICPSAGNDTNERDRPHETNLVMIVGSGTVSNGPNSVRLKDIHDGCVSTILAAETKDSGIRWPEPRDLETSEMSYRVNDRDAPSIRSAHKGGANVVFCDGSARFLSEETDPEVVRALTTIAGGEDVTEFFRDERAPSSADEGRPEGIARTSPSGPPTRGGTPPALRLGGPRHRDRWGQAVVRPQDTSGTPTKRMAIAS
jgi:prepilin-type processing-associated H-X9-DG protein